MKKLTEREVDILKLITKGYDNNQISKKIFVSIHTVKAHISSIIRKLDAKNRTNAVYIAIKNHMILIIQTLLKGISSLITMLLLLKILQKLISY